MVLEGQKILVVDDDMLILLALSRAYRSRPLDISTAASADHALSLLGSARFDLFIIDLDLHDRSGFELLRSIDDQFPYVPVILNTAADITSSELTLEIAQLRKKGIWHLMEKPFSFDLLNGLIEKYLAQQENRLINNLTHSQARGEDQRNHQRKVHIVPTELSFDAIRNGEMVRETIKAILTDISECGAGLLTRHCLEPSQVICFDNSLDQKCGVVAWSTAMVDQTCRAGIHFC